MTDTTAAKPAATLPALLDRAVEAFGDEPWLAFEDSTMTFGQLRERVDVLARAFLAAGIEPGDRVGLFLRNCADWLPIEYAVTSIGADLEPLNTMYRARELAHVVATSRMRLLVWGSSLVSGSTLPLLRELAPHLEKGGLPAAKLPDLATVVGVGEADWPEAVLGWPAFRKGADAVPTGAVRQRAAAVRAEDTALVLFTSGTTGKPKGVMLAHGGVVGHLAQWAAHLGLGPTDRTVMPSPLFWTFGCVLNALVPLHTGSMIVLHEAFDAEAMLRDIDGYGCTLLQGVPTQYELLLKHPDSEHHDLSSLRLVQIGGSASAETLARRLLERAPSARFVSAYGITEASAVNTWTDLDDDLGDVVSTVGHAAPDNEIVVRAPGGDEDRPAGEVGELCIRGATVMTGYVDAPAETARVLRDGWLHTGDLAVMDARGYLSIVGRAVDAYKRGGANVYPAEIEGVLTEHPDVRVASVIGVPDAELGQVGAAYVVARPGASLDAAKLQAHCRQALATYKVPARIEVVAELPMTPSGKVQKFRLCEQRPG
jgi:acyl-CoA synthetase (AMP-forming)/AMP-acid ligase II